MATVLIVEDDADYRSSLRRALKSKGYEVREAETVAEATAIIQEKNVAVVLLDLQLGAESGMRFFSSFPWLISRGGYCSEDVRTPLSIENF